MSGPDADPAADASPLSLHVLRGAPSEQELAAVIAVVSEAYAGEVDEAVADDAPAGSAWNRSARAARRTPESGSVWGRFEG